MSNSIVQYMSQPNVQSNIEQTLKDRAPQFVASVAALFNSNPKIAACDKKSVLSSCLIAASLDLPINQNLGFAYIIPYNVKVKGGVDQNGKELYHYEQQAQFQMGWKGFVQLAIRTDKYKFINTRDVRDGELVGEDFLSGEITFNWQKDRENLPTVGYVAYFKLLSGFEKMLYMSIDDLKKHGAKYSKSYKYGQWTEDPDGMMRKTVLKLLISKYGLMTSQLAKAIDSDQAIVSDGKAIYIDNQPADAHEIADGKERERVLSHISNCQTVEELEQCEDVINDYGSDVTVAYNNKKTQLMEDK